MSKNYKIHLISGAIIGSTIEEWTKKMGRLRLSQVLDMYYSRRGINFDKDYRACQRKENIKKLLKSVDLVQQTTSVAKLLQYTMHPTPGTVTISDDEISTYAETVVDTFISNIGNSINTYYAIILRILRKLQSITGTIFRPLIVTVNKSPSTEL